MSILYRLVPVNLSNQTCVKSSGMFAAVNRAIFTAHAAESDNADYRAMLAREHDKRNTFERGDALGYDPDVCYDVDIDSRNRAILRATGEPL